MRLEPIFSAVALVAALSPALLAAQTATTAQPAPEVREVTDSRLLDTVVVSGSAAGPALWHVDNGENQMWILATLSPLPAGIEWETSTLRERVSASQEVLWEPYYSVDVQSGFFRRLSLGYNMLKAGKNPDGKTLSQVMPPELYARWRRLKARYLPNDRAVEQKRPILAAQDLFNAAIAAHGLSTRRIWAQPLREAAQAAGAKSTAPRVEVRIDADRARAMLREVQSTTFNDAACMEATLDAIEQDLPRVITNANAWASGDLERIDFRQIQRRDRACTDVFSNNEVSRRYGLPNITQAIQNRFMQEAEAALMRNRSTVAVVSLQNMMGPNGYAAKLRAKGYEVSGP